MAKEVKSAAEEAPPPAKGGSHKLLIIIIALLVVVLLIGGAGAFFLLTRHSADNVDEEEEVAVETVRPKKKVKGAPPVYVALDTFTVNLVPENRDQFVQLVLSVEIDDAEYEEKIKVYSPKIRNNVMLLLSSKKASELLTKEGKEKLASEIRDQVNQIVDPGARGNDVPIREVLFTSFIIQ